MATLYSQNIDDAFTSPTGQLDYNRGDLSGVPTLKHYDLRSFYSSPAQITRTQLDMEFWNAAHFDGMTQSQIETFAAPSGGENWPTGDPNVTFSFNSSYRYMPQMAVVLTGGVTKTVTSLRTENILSNWSDDTYFIELLLPQWPGSPPMDLANSFVDFSSDPTFATQVDSIRFNQSTNSLTGSGDKVFRIPRSLLVNTNLGALAGIRFRLLSSSGQTVRFGSMRMLSASYPYEEIAIDTNLGVLRRSPAQNGTTEVVTSFGPMFFRNVQPKNTTLSARFNSGTNPVGNDNSIIFYLRYQDSNNWIRAELRARSTQARIRIVQNLVGTETELASTPINTNILTANKNFYFRASLVDRNVRASIFNSSGAFPTNELFTTGTVAAQEISRGYVGYEFIPYHYDFTLDYVGNEDVEFATFESTPYKTITPVKGATLITNDSPPIALNEDINETNSGDGVLTYEASLAGNADVERVERTGGGSSWYGGWQYQTQLFLGDTDHVTIAGSVYPVDVVNGQYRIALLDNNGSVIAMIPLPVTRANQWNNFQVRLGGALPPNSYYFYIHQIGFHPDTFYTNDVFIQHESVAWYAQPDYGRDWQPFLQAIDNPHTGLKFASNGNAIKIRAVAISDKAWIQGYQLRPLYDTTVETVFAIPNFVERANSVRTTGRDTVASMDQNVSIVGT
jgi:hypothetical protein